MLVQFWTDFGTAFRHNFADRQTCPAQNPMPKTRQEPAKNLPRTCREPGRRMTTSKTPTSDLLFAEHRQFSGRTKWGDGGVHAAGVLDPPSPFGRRAGSVRQVAQLPLQTLGQISNLFHNPPFTNLPTPKSPFSAFLAVFGSLRPPPFPPRRPCAFRRASGNFAIWRPMSPIWASKSDTKNRLISDLVFEAFWSPK